MALLGREGSQDVNVLAWEALVHEQQLQGDNNRPV